MRTVDLSHAIWKKSSHSSANGSCVEVAHVDGAVAIRDSTNPGGAVLVFAPDVWTAFLTAVRDREFDLR